MKQKAQVALLYRTVRFYFEVKYISKKLSYQQEQLFHISPFTVRNNLKIGALNHHFALTDIINCGSPLVLSIKILACLMSTIV